MAAKVQEQSFDNTFEFIVEAAKKIHLCGAPADQLERGISRLAKSFGIRAVVQSTPSTLLLSLRKNDQEIQDVYFEKISQGYEMTKMADIGNILHDLETKKIAIAEAKKQLDKVEQVPDPYGIALITLSYFLSGVGIAAILSGGWHDILFSGILSVVAYVVIIFHDKWGNKQLDSTNFIAALVITLLAILLKTFYPELNLGTVILSAIITLLPGFAVSIGFMELVSKNVVSGSENLTNGLVSLVKLAAGTWIGFEIGKRLMTYTSATPAVIDPMWLWLLTPCLFIGLTIVFQTSPKDFFWAILCCLFAYAGVTYGSRLMGSNLGNLFGAIAAGLFANTWERITNRPSFIVLLPALMVLVGGTVGFRGLLAAINDRGAGATQFLEMFAIALTLGIGLIIANSIIKPASNRR